MICSAKYSKQMSMVAISRPTFKGSPVATIVSCKIKMKNGSLIGEPEGTPLEFA